MATFNPYAINPVGTPNTYLASTGSAVGWQVASQTATNALVIKNGKGEDVLTLHNDGIIETASGKIAADDWVQITILMKQFIMDVAQDPDAASKYPYLKEAAHGWLVKELTK